VSDTAIVIDERQAAGRGARPRRNPRGWTWWLAWGMWLATLALFGSALAIVHAVGHSAATQQNGWLARGALLAAFLAFAFVGALVASRQPANAVGWIFGAIPLFVAFDVASGEYANLVLVEHPGSHPGGVVAAWIALWTWYPVLCLVVLLPMVFPTGRAPGPHWRLALRAMIAFDVLVVALWTVRPGPMSDAGKPALPSNPLGIGFLQRLYGGLEGVTPLVGLSFLIVSAAAAVARFRRSRGDERQQLKWMTYGLAVWAVWVPLSMLAAGDLADVFMALAFAVLPAATAIAMFKYHLYEIDRVISRTLVYGSLTVILGAAYAALVLASQAVFSSFAGGSNLAIAVSTLVVAALFLPVRSRVQRLVDRRFYRRRYDAQQTLEAFAARLRREVDLATLAEELRGALQETVEPAHVSLWLRDAR
jgi:hypothetical protein